MRIYLLLKWTWVLNQGTTNSCLFAESTYLLGEYQNMKGEEELKDEQRRGKRKRELRSKEKNEKRKERNTTRIKERRIKSGRKEIQQE